MAPLQTDDRKPKAIYYGWILVGVGLICYGFGISPAYYSWGFYVPEMREELGLSAGQTGSIFGVFVFMLSFVSPLAGMAILRWGLRPVITLGALACALSFWLTSRSHAAWEFYLYFALLGGVGLGFSSVLAWQTVATYWFRRHVARALAIMFTGGALVGMGVNPFNAATLEGVGWRSGWSIIAAISLAVAAISAIFVRQSPERMGLHPDGIAPEEDGREGQGAAAESQAGRSPKNSAPNNPNDEAVWTARKAIRTPQFAILTAAAIGYSMIWGVVSAHGASHLRTMLGFSAGRASLMVGVVRVGTSAVGRLGASFGDVVSPQKLLALGIALEAVGVGMLALVTSQGSVYFAMILIGLGYGGAYISSPVVFGQFFGRQAFATTNGARILITGFFSYLAPTISGWIADRTGSFALAYYILMAIALGTAAIVVSARRPALPEQLKIENRQLTTDN